MCDYVYWTGYDWVVLADYWPGAKIEKSSDNILVIPGSKHDHSAWRVLYRHMWE